LLTGQHSCCAASSCGACAAGYLFPGRDFIFHKT